MKSFFIFLDKLIVNKFYVILFCILLFSSSIISFILKINLSTLLGPQDLSLFLLDFDIKTRTGGVVSDLATHWAYITHLKEDFSNLFKLEMGVDTNLINFPLHNIIFSQIYFFNDSLKNYLIIVFVTSLLLPIIFFLCLLLHPIQFHLPPVELLSQTLQLCFRVVDLYIPYGHRLAFVAP